MSQPSPERSILPDFMFTNDEDRRKQVASFKKSQRKRLIQRLFIALIVVGMLGYGLARWADSVIEQPAISAQDRTTAFLSGLYTMIGNHHTLTPEAQQHAINQFHQTYLIPQGRYQNIVPELIDPNLQYIASTNVYSLEYRVVDQNPSRIELVVEKGWIDIHTTDGQTLHVPMSQLVSRIVLINVKAVWYVDDVTFTSGTIEGTRMHAIAAI